MFNFPKVSWPCLSMYTFLGQEQIFFVIHCMCKALDDQGLAAAYFTVNTDMKSQDQWLQQIHETKQLMYKHSGKHTLANIELVRGGIWGRSYVLSCS